MIAARPNACTRILAATWLLRRLAAAGVHAAAILETLAEVRSRV
jgi:hypothetical protein